MIRSRSRDYLSCAGGPAKVKIEVQARLSLWQRGYRHEGGAVSARRGDNVSAPEAWGRRGYCHPHTHGLADGEIQQQQGHRCSELERQGGGCAGFLWEEAYHLALRRCQW